MPPWLMLNMNTQTLLEQYYSDSNVDGANKGPIWGRQVPGGPHVGPMNFTIWIAL